MVILLWQYDDVTNLADKYLFETTEANFWRMKHDFSLKHKLILHEGLSFEETFFIQWR